MAIMDAAVAPNTIPPVDVIDRFIAVAELYPDHPAVATRSVTVTYRELLLRVRAFAAQFAVTDSPRVLIALPQGPDAYAGMFAAALAGGYYVPVNVAAPIDKVMRILRLLKPDVILSSGELAKALATGTPRVPVILPGVIDCGTSYTGRGKRNETAYVIFTSGSTGEPKGVVIPRFGLDHYVAWLIDHFQFGLADRISQHPNIAFDLSVMDIYGALCAGATLFPLVEEHDRMLPARFIARNKLSVWISVPSVVSLMMRGREINKDRTGSLRLFAFCGEPLLREHLEAIFGASTTVQVENMYGPTEATVSMTSLRLNVHNYQEVCHATAAIGDPIANMGLHLVGGADDDEGEIAITGPQLAYGYWQDAARSEERFRPLLVGGNTVRAYFTGDWAERRNGHVYFKERLDFQVKIRGFRLELDEVEAAIRASGWPMTCVLKWRDRLAAVIECVEPETFDDAALRRALAKKIEAHGIPEIIRAMPLLPRSENDKLDRAAVAAWLDSQAGHLS